MEQRNSCSYNFACVYVYIYRVYVHTNFRILLFRCSSCSINRGVLYVYTTLDDKNYVNQQHQQLVSYLSLRFERFFQQLARQSTPCRAQGISCKCQQVYKSHYFFTFSFGKIWKSENLFVSLQSILEERARKQEQRPIAQRKVIKNKPKITLTELQGLIIKV